MIHEELSGKIIGAAMEVLNALKPVLRTQQPDEGGRPDLRA